MRVLLIDDHALVRKGLEALLQSRGIEIAGSIGTGKEGVSKAKELDPDIVLLDIKMPEMNGLETLQELRKEGVDIPVLMLTMSREEKDLECALRAGAQGYLLKDMDPEELVPSLNDALKGDKVYSKGIFGPLTRIVQGQTASPAESEEKPDALSDLTPREKEILGHIARSRSNKVIARKLGISDGTVKLHVRSILRKFNMRSRVEVAVWAVEHGIKGEPD